MMNGKKTRSNGGLGVIDVIGINIIMLKVLEVEPVARWPWWLVLSPWLMYLGLIAVSALVASYAASRKSES